MLKLLLSKKGVPSPSDASFRGRKGLQRHMAEIAYMEEEGVGWFA
ncbi:MAG: hypothetical protein SOY99_01300 [Alloprevotella sp.]|nr:hypothetical protein [Alloprevotella sp.]